MRNLPVHWSEGMFLRPQHFQAADRYWTEQLQASEEADHAYNYGLSRFELSLEALANAQFQINVCHARLRDGTLVILDQGQEPDRVNVRDALNQAQKNEALKVDLQESFNVGSTVRLYLGVPKLKLGSANVSTDDSSNKQRYIQTSRQFQDESTGGNDQDVRLKTLNVRLLLGTQDLSGYEVLPIAQIQRSGARDGTPKLDPNYIPPLLGADAWPPLARDILRTIYDFIGRRIETLSQDLAYRGESLATHEQGDLDRVLLLSQLNEAYATLGVLAFAARVHPLVCYTELCRIVGGLSLFDPTRRCAQVPKYDHDDLATIFYWAKERIEFLALRGPVDEFEQRPFFGSGLGMQATFDDKWLVSDWKWYVGVQHENISDAECAQLIAEKGVLDWKLGSKPRVEMLFNYGLPGLILNPVETTPRALPRSGSWRYYELSREGPEWKEVFSTKTLAMRFNHKLIQDPEALAGKRRIAVNYRGKQADLEFALFAVRTTT